MQKNPNKTEFRIEKVIKKKVMKFILSGKVIIIHLIAGLIKKNSLYKMSYLPEHNSHSKKEDKRRIRFLSLYNKI